MLNIHLKIEAKKTVEINIILLQKISNADFKNSVVNLYNRFENSDYFMLPYKVNKLSKRARRNLI